MKKNKSSRQYVQILMEGTNGLVHINDAQKAFNIPREQTSRLLYRLAKQGWIRKIQNGLYRVVALEASDSSLTDESPWLISNQLFNPCYIGCWTAANHWGLTDQLFLDTWVVTSEKVFVKKRVVADHHFILRQVPTSHFFGLTYEWIENNKIAMSDPHKTVLDFLSFPEAFSSQSMIDILKGYLVSRQKDISILSDYSKNITNKAVLKRLGFLLEYLHADAYDLIEYCSKNKSKGNSRLSILTPYELIKLQKATGLLLSTIEKDYVLGLLIWSFTQNSNLNTQWIFKGGTCLKKCYFKDYRFSEDLDYTLIPEAPIDPNYIHKELSVCSELLLERFGLRIDVDHIEIAPFPDKSDRFIQ
eukprot:gene294-383_t